MAERIRGEDADEDVDAFLKESRDSLHGKYWGPDSLVPVRLVDMRDDPPPAPVPKRARIRPLDVVVGAVGFAAVVMIGLSLRNEKQAPAAVAAPKVHARTMIAPPSHPVEHVAVAREVIAPPVAPPPPAVEMLPVEAPRSAEPLMSEAPPAPVQAASAAPSASVAATEPSAAPKKHRPKPAASHTPPTASFPD